MAARAQRQARAVVRELSRWPGANERRDAETARAVQLPEVGRSLAGCSWGSQARHRRRTGREQALCACSLVAQATTKRRRPRGCYELLRRRG
jgi:hypothetical protein